MLTFKKKTLNPYMFCTFYKVLRTVVYTLLYHYYCITFHQIEFYDTLCKYSKEVFRVFISNYWSITRVCRYHLVPIYNTFQYNNIWVLKSNAKYLSTWVYNYYFLTNTMSIGLQFAHTHGYSQYWRYLSNTVLNYFNTLLDRLVLGV